MENFDCHENATIKENQIFPMACQLHVKDRKLHVLIYCKLNQTVKKGLLNGIKRTGTDYHNKDMLLEFMFRWFHYFLMIPCAGIELLFSSMFLHWFLICGTGRDLFFEEAYKNYFWVKVRPTRKLYLTTIQMYSSLLELNIFCQIVMATANLLFTPAMHSREIMDKALRITDVRNMRALNIGGVLGGIRCFYGRDNDICRSFPYSE